MGATPEPTPVDVFLDPVVQLAALCPICALAALRPEAALAALAPALAVFNPAVNPRAAALAFSLTPRQSGVVQRSGQLSIRPEGIVQRAGLRVAFLQDRRVSQADSYRLLP
jgi:hypothetical protein